MIGIIISDSAQVSTYSVFNHPKNQNVGIEIKAVLIKVYEFNVKARISEMSPCIVIPMKRC